ncbi:helix-turn-helix domain-containing protein [uncultured Odoribacter sp.]|uniref:helix-turn-helix domain-containing protein n=1 Tax=uncultured Odoribacter sp. TaxID=876416 RepID=UPI0026244CD8|nr:helix-turn-helix domain-containing protein [uncultured Odoribacter sp.]
MSVYRYLRKGKIKAVRFEGKTLIRRSDIDKMFDFLIVSEKLMHLKRKHLFQISTPLPRQRKNLVSQSLGFSRSPKTITSPNL